MTKEDQLKAEIMHKQMLNQAGISQLAKLDIYRKLILALSIADLQNLEKRNIYLNPSFSPASQTDLSIVLKGGSKIITLDINTLKLFSSEEGVAIILHEIGHSMNPALKGEDGEFVADDYADNRSYGMYIISSLEKGKTIRPEEFAKEMTERRIKRLEEKIN